MILRVTPFPNMRATGLEMTMCLAVVRRTIPWEMIDKSIYPNDYLHSIVDSMEESLRQFLVNSASGIRN